MMTTGIKMFTLLRTSLRPFRRYCSTVTSINTSANDGSTSIQERVGPPDVSLELLKLNHREQRLSQLLAKNEFNDRQISIIIRDFRENNVIYDIDPKIITNSIKFWTEHVTKPKKHSVVGTTPGEEYDFQDIVALQCPRLLLINPEKMLLRIKALKKIGFLTGRNDLWTVFTYAPVAYFLQDWTDFCQKFFYVQYRVLEFLIDKHKDPFPTPHPLVKACKVFELPYTTIKARFEFLIKTGIKTPAAVFKATGKPQNYDLAPIFLYELDRYLKKFAPSVSEEEYNVFEKMIEEYPDDEDKTLQEICELNNMASSIEYGIVVPMESEESEKKYDQLQNIRRKVKEDKILKASWRGRKNKLTRAVEEEDGEDNEEDHEEGEEVAYNPKPLITKLD